jgi:hypothetical protein
MLSRFTSNPAGGSAKAGLSSEASVIGRLNPARSRGGRAFAGEFVKSDLAAGPVETWA